jgi:hypothetical protein
MIFHPLILALTAASSLTAFLILYASVFGLQVLRRWDIRSGSETQVGLERKTYLISTLLAFLFGAQLLSLFLFIFTADRLHDFFIGAMCAAGTLNVNNFGYPALLLKVVNFFLAGVWLILNRADNRGYDYPLIRTKYRALLLFAPLFLAEAFVQTRFFLKLEPAIITSCCGSLFSLNGGTVLSDIVSLPAFLMKIVFYLSFTTMAAAGAAFLRRSRSGYLFAGLSVVFFLISILSILSFVSVYIYELPAHHCPFCILQKEYGFIGYPLYIALFAGGIFGAGVGILMPFRNVRSLATVIPPIQKKLALASISAAAVFVLIVTLKWITSGLILGPDR